jgi:drug/metabolite transporter (DMT)-like permease
VTLWLICAIKRVPMPRSLTTWKHLVVLASLLNAVPFTLFAYGETHISSLLAGIINASTPLFAFAGFFLVFPQERASRDRLLGLCIGLAGVIVVLGVWNGMGSGEWSGIMACVLAVTCYGISFPYMRRYVVGLPEGPLSISAGQLTCAAVLLLPFVAFDTSGHGHFTSGVVLGMLALGSLGSGVAYILNFHVTKTAGGTVASTVTYLTPIMAVIVGVAFLDEQLHWYEPLGTLIILLGAAITQGRIKLRSTNLTQAS